MTTDPAPASAAASAAASAPDDAAVLVVDVRTVVSVIVALLATFALFAVVDHAGQTLTRIGIGLVLALALDGLVTRIRRRFGLSRAPAVMIVGLGLFSVMATVILVLGPPAIEQAGDLASSLPDTVRELYDLPIVGQRLEDADAAEAVDRWADDLPSNVSTDSVRDLAESLLGGLATAVIVVITTFAALLDGERLVALFRNALPSHRRSQADRAGRVFYRVVGRYFGGSLTVAVLMGLYVLTLALAFDVPLAPLAAVWAMLTNLIPQVGGFLGGALLAVLALATGAVTALVVVALFVVYMNVENHLIQPTIVGSAVDLSPPTTMLAALIGGAALGIPGALIATPVVGAGKRLWFEFRAEGGPPVDDEPVSLRQRLTALVGRRRSPSG